MSALDNIRKAGFEVELANGNLSIHPFSKLTPQQIDFLKVHKAEIIQELEAANDDAKVCKQCRYFTPDKINPPAGLGRCQQDINRKNKPLYPNQDVCDRFESFRLVAEAD